MGSKYKLLYKLIPLFPKDKSTFYDLFTGGGSVYMNVAHLYKTVVANDILNSLVEIHKHLQNDGFINRAANLSISTKDSQEEFLRLRHYYNSCGNPDVLLALIWSCNSNMMRFNNEFRFNQTWGKRCFNKNTQKKVDSLKGNDFSNVVFISDSFYDITGLYNSDNFIYLDPPYSNTEVGYNAFWSGYDEDNLIALVQSFIDNNVSFGLSGSDVFQNGCNSFLTSKKVPAIVERIRSTNLASGSRSLTFDVGV